MSSPSSIIDTNWQELQAPPLFEERPTNRRLRTLQLIGLANALHAARAAAPSKPISAAKSLPEPTLTADLSEASNVQRGPLDCRVASRFRMIKNAVTGTAAREMKHLRVSGRPPMWEVRRKGLDEGNLAE